VNPAEAIEITRESIYILIKISAPVMLIGLVVGLIISLFQALTQIQEATISFVPKIVVVFLAMILFAPFMYSSLQAFTLQIFDRIVTVG
jgi:flagellar biosynthetic protein FliQ